MKIATIILLVISVINMRITCSTYSSITVFRQSIGNNSSIEYRYYLYSMIVGIGSRYTGN